MAPSTPSTTLFFEDNSSNKYLNTIVSGLTQALWFVALVLCGHLLLVTIGLTWRLLSLVFGRRIKQNGKKAILITGATSGIGLVLAKQFYRIGFTVFAAYYNDQEPGYRELLEISLRPYESAGRKRVKCGTEKPHLFLIQMDVRSQESIEAASAEVDDLLERHDIDLYCLINNAGISRDGPFELSSREGMSDIVNTNLNGVISVTKQFLIRIIQSKGRIINVSSGLYRLPGPTLTLYGGIKAAIAYFSDSLNQDLKPYGVTCHCMIPGNFVTSSNIIYTRVRYIQDSLSKLSETEKLAFQKSANSSASFVNQLLKEKLERSGDDPHQISAIYNIQIPDLSGNIQRKSIFRRIKTFLFRSIDGSSEKSLEKSGVFRSYEDAVCLVNPPRRLYAGSLAYQYIFGPLMEYAPPFICEMLTNMLVTELT